MTTKRHRYTIRYEGTHDGVDLYSWRCSCGHYRRAVFGQTYRIASAIARHHRRLTRARLQGRP